MGKVSRMNTVAPLSLTGPEPQRLSVRARSAESCGMPAVTRAQKITFGEMRLLIYCADYHCSHS